MKYKIITVTPAGRYPYMQILHRYLLRNRHVIHKHIWWQNTRCEEDIAYMRYLASTFPYFYEIQELEPGQAWDGCFSIHHFFKKACDPEAIYIRLDDDICWIDTDAIERLAAYRASNQEPFLVSGNVINSALCNVLHQRSGALPSELACTWDARCPFSWKEPDNSRHFHHSFFHHLNEDSLDRYVFDPHTIENYDRFSINCISWLGKDFAEFNGEVGRDEEDWLTCQKPREINRPCVILGSALFVHFAFYTQRDYLEQKSNCLQLYGELSRETSQAH